MNEVDKTPGADDIKRSPAGRTAEGDAFTRESEADRIGLVAEFWDFLKHNKKWWLLPILIAIAAILALLAFALIGGGSAAPFIYPLF